MGTPVALGLSLLAAIAVLLLTARIVKALRGPGRRPRRGAADAADVLANAPGPSPYYRGGGPQIPGFTWSAGAGETTGAAILSSGDGAVLVLDFYNYALLAGPDALLVWHLAPVDSGPTAPVVLRLFALSNLEPLKGDLGTLCASMRQAKLPLVSASGPLCEFPMPTTVASECEKVTFPEQVAHLEELLILCHSSAVEESPPAKRSNLALLVARPRDGTYNLVPQDWFNFAKLDYSYQGVKRVARNPATGEVHGDGVRIEPFVLDPTLRNLA